MNRLSIFTRVVTVLFLGFAGLTAVIPKGHDAYGAHPTLGTMAMLFAAFNFAALFEDL